MGVLALALALVLALVLVLVLWCAWVVLYARLVSYLLCCCSCPVVCWIVIVVLLVVFLLCGKKNTRSHVCDGSKDDIRGLSPLRS